MIALAVVAAWIACGVLGSEIGRRGINKFRPKTHPMTWRNDSFLIGMAIFGPLNLVAVML